MYSHKTIFLQQLKFNSVTQDCNFHHSISEKTLQSPFGSRENAPQVIKANIKEYKTQYLLFTLTRTRTKQNEQNPIPKPKQRKSQRNISRNQPWKSEHQKGKNLIPSPTFANRCMNSRSERKNRASIIPREVWNPSADLEREEAWREIRIERRSVASTYLGGASNGDTRVRHVRLKLLPCHHTLPSS